ncbi:MAG: ABC transporter permease [Nannocystaceae bacterium]
MREFLRCSWAFFRRDAQITYSYPLALLMGLAGTVMRVVVLWLPAQLFADSAVFARHGGFIPFAVVGSTIMGFFMASYRGFSSSVRAEQAMGTLESVLMTPASIAAIVTGSSSWTMTRALLDAAITLTAASLFFGLELRGSPLAILVLLVLTNLTFSAMGMFSAAFAVVFKRGDPFRVFVGGASFLLGGVLYPVEILPSWLRLAGEFLPVTYGARALRNVVLEGRALDELLGDLFMLGMFAVIAVPSGLFAFGWAINRAKRDGSLLHY